MRPLISVSSAVCALSLLLVPATGRAGTNLVSTTSVSATTGWLTSPGTWKTNNGSGVGIGTAVVLPFACNTYTLMPNGTPIGRNLGETRTRNVYSDGTPSGLFTFPGD